MPSQPTTSVAQADEIARLRAQVAQLQAGEAHFRALVETGTDWIWEIDPEGRYTFASPKVRELLGYAPEEILGRTPFDLMPPEEAERAMAALANVLAARLPFSGFQNINLHKDGRCVLLETSANPVIAADGRFMGYRGIDRDITERQAAEDARRREDARIRAFFDTTSEWLWTVDIEGRHIYCNPAVRSILGYEPAEMTGRSALEFIHDDDKPLVLRLLREKMARREGWSGLVLRWRAKDGDFRWLESTAVPDIDAAGQLCGFHGADRDITDRMTAERQRDRLFELSLDMLCTARFDGMLKQVNPAWTAILGWTVEELTSRPWIEFVHPDDRDATEAAGRELLAGGSVRGFENRYRCRDGSWRWLSWNSFPIPDESLIVCVVRDVTSDKSQQAALRQSEERYRQLFSLESDAVVVVDNETGRILEVNDAAVRTYGYTRDRWLSMKNTDVSAEPDKTRQAVLERQSSIPVRWHRKADGTVFPVEMTASFLEVDGRPAHMVAIRDITERLKAEEHRRELEAQMQQAQKLESLGVLAGGIAHDFNNILTAILGHANLARAELPADVPAQESLQEIEQASCRAAELCRQMLAYAGKGRIALEQVDLSRLVGDVLQLVRASISKKIRLSCHLPLDLPPIEADLVQIRQVVMNLIINASEAIGETDGVVRLSTGCTHCTEEQLRAWQPVTTALRPAGDYVYVEVDDNGTGMDEDTLGRIFDPFFSTKFTGRGLGLAAVLGIVGNHRGALHVQSVPGGGTTFRIYLPCLAVADEAAPEPAVVQAAPQMDRAGNGTVLVVDDEETVCRVATRMLERSGYAVLTARDGVEGVKALRENLSAVDAVVLDLSMPRMDGTEAFREMRKLRPDVPVLLASGYSDAEMLRRFPDAGVSGFIEKPYRLETLANKLHQALSTPSRG